MKKVLFVSSLYYPHVGGIETMIRELSRIYKKQGIEVDVLTKKWPDSLTDTIIYEGVPVYRIKNARTEDDFMAVVDWIRQNEKKIKSDIIHVIGARRPLPLIALLLKHLWKVPLILTIAGGDIPDKNDPFPGTVWKESEPSVYPVFDHADCITCVSDGITRDFKEFFPKVRSPIQTLLAGIDIEFINKAPKQTLTYKYIFSLRRLDPTKGIGILIEAFKIIVRSYPNLRLIIAGDGSERSRLEELVKTLNLKSNVDFIGTIELERGISLLKGAELTVVPSLSEAGGLVNVEAQAAGCPVVATRVGGIPEYVEDKVSGLLCQPGDPLELAEKITLILEDKDLREKIVKGGYAHANKFDWRTLAPQYLSLYMDLLQKFEEQEISKNALFKKMWDNLNL